MKLSSRWWLNNLITSFLVFGGFVSSKTWCLVSLLSTMRPPTSFTFNLKYLRSCADINTHLTMKKTKSKSQWLLTYCNENNALLVWCIFYSVTIRQKTSTTDQLRNCKTGDRRVHLGTSRLHWIQRPSHTLYPLKYSPLELNYWPTARHGKGNTQLREKKLKLNYWRIYIRVSRTIAYRAGVCEREKSILRLWKQWTELRMKMLRLSSSKYF